MVLQITHMSSLNISFRHKALQRTRHASKYVGDAPVVVFGGPGHIKLALILPSLPTVSHI